jgi:hypothetical protein
MNKKEMSVDDRLSKLEADQVEIKRDVTQLQGDARRQRIVISGLPGGA